MATLVIQLEKGKWYLNGTPFEKLTPDEKKALDSFFMNFKNGLVKANNRLKNLKSNNYKFKSDENN